MSRKTVVSRRTFLRGAGAAGGAFLAGAATRVDKAFALAEAPRTADPSRLIADTRGNVGVGTASPVTELHVTENCVVPSIGCADGIQFGRIA